VRNLFSQATQSSARKKSKTFRIAKHYTKDMDGFFVAPIDCQPCQKPSIPNETGEGSRMNEQKFKNERRSTLIRSLNPLGKQGNFSRLALSKLEC
jgi:hypothetical protein